MSPISIELIQKKKINFEFRIQLQLDLRAIYVNIVDLFDCNRLGQVSWAINIAFTQNSYVIGQKLHWNDS